VEEAIPVPTLGQVAEQERFAPLKELIRPVAETPVNELSPGMRTKLLEGEEKPTQLCLEAFFAACDALVEDIATKRAHIAHEGRLPGKHALFVLSFHSFYFFFFRSQQSSTLWTSDSWWLLLR
jgi:hypothetical protein